MNYAINWVIISFVLKVMTQESVYYKNDIMMMFLYTKRTGLVVTGFTI